MPMLKGQDGKFMVAFVVAVVIGLGVAAIVTSIIGSVLSNVQTTQLETGTLSAVETYTVDNVTAQTLTNARCVPSSVAIINATNGSQTYGSGNYSVACSSTSSDITWLTGTANNTSVNASYDYNFDQFPLDYNVTGQGMLGLGNLSSQFGLIGTVAGLIAVLVVLFMFFTRRKGGITGFV